MKQLDLSRKRSEKTVRRALRDYGEKLEAPHYYAFAKAIADGAPAYKAYQGCFPDASRETASVQASVLLAHPDMLGMIRDHAIGARNLAVSLAPGALRHLHTLSTTATKESKPQIDAVNSILDRGGLPRAKELSVHVGVVAAEAIAAWDDVDIVDVEPLEAGELSPNDLPAMEDAPAAAGAVDPLDAARSDWADVMPNEALRRVGPVSVAPDLWPEADDDADDLDGADESRRR